MAATDNALRCFKAYDIRGKLGEELTEHLAWCIGRAYARVVQPATVALGSDVRATSEPLKRALALGLLTEGVKVIDLGMTGTEEVYFAAQHLAIDGAIEVTASHNPIDYNGMKLVREQAKPISGDTGLFAIRDESVSMQAGEALARASETLSLDKSAYLQHLLEYVDVAALKPLKIVVNAGNGGAGLVVDGLVERPLSLTLAPTRPVAPQTTSAPPARR